MAVIVIESFGRANQEHAVKSKLLVGFAVFATALMHPTAGWAAVSFAPAVDYPVAGSSPLDITVGDLNGDGNPDVVTPNYGSSSVSVLLGNSDGTFDAPDNFTVGDGPATVQIGDLNGDGKPDFVTANQNDATLSVLLGNGDGTFAGAASVAPGGPVNSVAIGDLNDDGQPDLAKVDAVDSVDVLLGNGDGTFAPATSFTVPVGPFSLTIADLNDDGKLDVVTANTVASSISVLLGNGDGTLAAATTTSVGNFPTRPAIGDLNDDGKPDLATANANVGNVSVLLGNGDGTFAAATAYGTGPQPNNAAIGDVNGDGTPDLLVPSAIGNFVSVLQGNGDGTFESLPALLTGSVPFSARVADFDGDGDQDVATGNFGADSISILLNTTVKEFTAGPSASISGTVRQGQTLTADEGTPNPTPDSYSYKWFADGVEIDGETAKTLSLTAGYVNQKITVEVTAIKAGYENATDTSDPVGPVLAIFSPGPKASISGQARVGSTLTANAGSPSPTPTILGYRWFADGKQLTPVTKTLKLTKAHHGKRIQVRVYAIAPSHATATSLSAATARISNAQAKKLSMELDDYTVKRGQRVTADIKYLASGESWSIVFNGKKLASGKANSAGRVTTSFVVPSNAPLGKQAIRAYGLFPDRTDLDVIKVR